MMKKIIFTRPDESLSVVVPAEGSRLASRVRLADGAELVADTPRPVDSFVRGWPVDGAAPEWAETEEQWLARVIAKSCPPDAANVHTIDASEVPTDRTFRNAWQDTGVIGVNMPKAREIHKNNLRQIRAPLLAALDIAYQRADEAGDAALKVEIAAKKQALRDVTADPRIITAQTPEELKAVIPDVLK